MSFLCGDLSYMFMEYISNNLGHPGSRPTFNTWTLTALSRALRPAPVTNPFRLPVVIYLCCACLVHVCPTTELCRKGACRKPGTFAWKLMSRKGCYARIYTYIYIIHTDYIQIFFITLYRPMNTYTGAQTYA